jgi:O-antigen/teichoic acid export membrane protein
MSLFESIGRGAIFLVLSQIIEKALLFLTTIILARYLGTSDYGRLIYALSFANLFTFFWDFGIGRLITRDVATDRSNASALFSPKLKYQIFSCLVGISVLSLYVSLFEQRGTEAYLILILGVSMGFTHLSNSFRTIFIVFEKAEYETFFILIFRSSLLITVFLVTHIGLGLLWISLILLLFSLLSLLGSWALIQRNFFRPRLGGKRTNFLPIIKDSFPIALIIAFTTIYLQMNKILLLNWKGERAVGIYGAVEMIVMTLLILSNSLVLASFPVISKENKINREGSFHIYKGVFKLLAVLSLPIALGGMLLHKEIVLFIYGTDFMESSSVLKILIWLTPIIFLTNFTGSCLIAIEKQTQLATICGFNTLFNLSLNLILIPSLGVLGAAIASITTEGVNLIIQNRVLGYYWKESVFDPSYFKIFFSLGIMGSFIYWFRNWNLFIVLFGGTALYLLSLFAIRFYSQEDLSEIKKRFLKDTGGVGNIFYFFR